MPVKITYYGMDTKFYSNYCKTMKTFSRVDFNSVCLCVSVTKLVCHASCEGHCFGPNQNECCHPQCAGGCTAPGGKQDCWVSDVIRSVQGAARLQGGSRIAG